MENQEPVPDQPKASEQKPLTEVPAEVAVAPAPPAVKSHQSRLKFSWHKFNLRLTLAISILLKLGGIALAVLLIVLFWHEVSYSGYSIQEVSVPDAFGQNGYTGTTLATKIQGNLSEVKRVGRNIHDPLHLGVKLEGLDIANYELPDKNAELEVNMVGVGLPVRSFVNFIGSALGFSQSKRVTAFVTTSGGKATLTLNIAGNLSKGLSVNMDSLGMERAVNNLAWEATEHILKISNPELLAVYLLATEQPLNKVIAVCEHAVKVNQDTTRNKFIYYAWAFALWKDHQKKEAELKFRKSLAADPDWLGPYLALDGLLLESGQFEKARMIIREAKRRALMNGYDKEQIEPLNFMGDRTEYAYLLSAKKFDSAYLFAKKNLPDKNERKSVQADRYNTIAYCLSEGGRYDSAVYYAEKAVALDSTMAVSYTTLAEIYGYQKDREKFYTYLEKAFVFGFSPNDLEDRDAPYSDFSEEKRYKQLRAKYGR